MDRLKLLREAGVSIWLDTISRDLLESDRFERYVHSYGVTGATSNPTIFEKAITGSSAYDGRLRELAELEVGPKAAFFDLALRDVRDAARVLLPAYEASGGSDGFISFEVTPDLAYDENGTVEQALALWKRLGLANAMIKVPATSAGVAAVERLTAFGVNVNVTLLFSVERYEEIIEAYLRGLERRLDAGRPLEGISSVASFFVSRIDAKAHTTELAVANALRAYARQRELFAGPRWEKLLAAGAREQRPLWASTGTKDPSLSDVHYVESLVTPGAINTMPEKTLLAFADHGEVRAPERDVADVDLGGIGEELEREGVESFSRSYEHLLEVIESKLAGYSPPGWQTRSSHASSSGDRHRKSAPSPTG